MKKRNFGCLAAAALFALSGGLRAADDMKAVPVAGGLYLMEGLAGGNVAFLSTEEGVLVVDSGTTPEEGERIMDEIAKVTGKPIRYLVLTHYHGDHTFGLQAYPESVVVIAQQNTAGNIRKLNEPRMRNALEKQVPEMIAAQKLKVENLRKKKAKDLQKEEAALKALETQMEEMKGLRFVHPAVTFDSKLRILLGGVEVEVSHPGPAHTNGDAWVYFPALKVLHMGDDFFSGSYPYIGAEAGADTANWIEKLKQASEMDAEKFIPGHGPIAGKEGLLRFAAYLAGLRQAVQAAIAGGQTLEQIKKMTPLPAWKDLKWPEMLPRNIEAVYNELTQAR